MSHDEKTSRSIAIHVKRVELSSRCQPSEFRRFITRKFRENDFFSLVSQDDTNHLTLNALRYFLEFFVSRNHVTTYPRDTDEQPVYEDFFALKFPQRKTERVKYYFSIPCDKIFSLLSLLFIVLSFRLCSFLKSFSLGRNWKCLIDILCKDVAVISERMPLVIDWTLDVRKLSRWGNWRVVLNERM